MDQISWLCEQQWILKLTDLTKSVKYLVYYNIHVLLTMALQINTLIGTDRGITSEAYIRISNYSISKTGTAQFHLQLFLNKNEAAQPDIFLPYIASAFNQEIGSSLYVYLIKNIETPVTKTRTILQEVTVEKEIPQVNEYGKPVLDESGNQVVTTVPVKEFIPIEEEYTETVNNQVTDLSPLENVDIFEFGYSKLKEHLSVLYGAENIVDC